MNDIDLNEIKVYHIVHISKLVAILKEGFLVSDAEIQKRPSVGVTIGMTKIKERRLSLPLSSVGLHVGDCVPFYFCPRSPMLYMLSRANHQDIEYRGGQEPIVHLVFSMRNVINWAEQEGRKWAFTESNAGSRCFEDFADLADLDKLDWNAIRATLWSGRQDKKQAEFLVEKSLPWQLVEKIGVYSLEQYSEVCKILEAETSRPQISVERSWYY
ncbi:DUF4433 domain-containing protein [Deferribacterales bacterium RsTz2092]|nr:hypothetical protein AGMMS49941_07560 [Deferribacterales bacterium]